MAKDLFIAFTGPKVEQAAAVYEISPGFECWDLSKFKMDEFLTVAQERIPPMNDNVLGNYRREPDANTPFGIDFEDYSHCSWGLFLPDLVQDSLGYGYSEILFVLNLYSPRFLSPIFYLSDFGIQRLERPAHLLLYYHDQGQSQLFKRVQFVDFYKLLISEAGYGSWQSDRMARWDLEDMRVFVACLLFSGLRSTEHRKDVFTWQRESADMSTILEALFTAGTGDNTEVGYKLRKRIAAMMARQFPHIEKEIKELYKQRSSFVHGAFFLQIRKKIEITDGYAKFPSPPFHMLYQQKECIRFALAAYIYLNKVRKAGTPEFMGCNSVLETLERAVIDLQIRTAVNMYTDRLFNLMK